MGELPIAHGRRSITSGGEISGREGRSNGRMSERANEASEGGREEWAKSPSPRLAKGRQRKTVVRVRPRREWRRHDATLAELMPREAEARSETLACISKRENDERERWRESQSVRQRVCDRSIERRADLPVMCMTARIPPAAWPWFPLRAPIFRRTSPPPFLPSSLRSTSFVFTFSRRARPSTLSLAFLPSECFLTRLLPFHPLLPPCPLPLRCPPL